MRAAHIGLVAASALATAAGIVWTGDDPFEGIEDGPVLTQLKRESHFGVTASDGRKLYDVAMERKVKRAPEVGTSQGYLALWIGAAMTRTWGRPTTIEISAGRAADAAVRFREAGLSGVAINRRLFDLFKEKLAPGAGIVCHNGATPPVRQRNYPEIRSCQRAGP